MKRGSPRELVTLILMFLAVILGVLAFYGNWIASFFGFGPPPE